MPPADDDARRWARTVLGMSAGDDARFALLRQVKAARFNPSADLGAAFRVVSRPFGDTTDVGRLLESAGFGYDREMQRRQAVDAFADQFFSLRITERADRFRTLTSQCGSDPLLEGRLARLARGLEIDFDRPVSLPEEERVVAIVRELFTLAPEERATRRRELLREVGRDRPFDIKTLDRLRTSWPELARLDVELWRKLESAVAGWRPRRMQPVIERAPAVAAAPAPSMSRGEAVALGRHFFWLIGIPLIVGLGLGVLRSGSKPGPDFGRQNPGINFDQKKVNEVLKDLHGKKLVFDKKEKRIRVVEDDGSEK
jgi:hypothetical protein